jgi:uridine monophosphate synthetase
MGFFTELEQRARQIDSLLCIGLDPHPADLESATPAALRSFCLRLIEATAETALAFKPNAAFFEAFGSDGMAVLKEVIAAIPNGIPVILDAKRGDIASTAEAYAAAAFQTLGAHALTASPYLGRDSLEPFLKDPARGVFLLCKTSNPGSGDFQDLTVHAAGSPLLYEIVARRAAEWNVNDNLGLVAGATHPEALRRVRAAAPDLWILAPGVGAQGGDLHSTLAAGLRADGSGLLVTVSRAVSRAADPGQAARDLRDAINRGRTTILKAHPPTAPMETGITPLQARIADRLLEAGCVRFGQFTLKSGLISPIYIDLRQLATYPDLLEQVADAYLPMLAGLKFDRVAALPYAALPIGTAICLHGSFPLVYPRKEVKSYGTKAEIEGLFVEGETVVVIDDLTTTGGTKFEAIEKLTGVGLRVNDVVVLVDRQSGAAEALARRGIRLHAVLTLTQMLDHWDSAGRVAPDLIDATRAFLASPGG